VIRHLGIAVLNLADVLALVGHVGLHATSLIARMTVLGMVCANIRLAEIVREFPSAVASLVMSGLTVPHPTVQMNVMVMVLALGPLSVFVMPVGLEQDVKTRFVPMIAVLVECVLQANASAKMDITVCLVNWLTALEFVVARVFVIQQLVYVNAALITLDSIAQFQHVRTSAPAMANAITIQGFALAYRDGKESLVHSRCVYMIAVGTEIAQHREFAIAPQGGLGQIALTLFVKLVWMDFVHSLEFAHVQLTGPVLLVILQFAPRQLMVHSVPRMETALVQGLANAVTIGQVLHARCHHA
jgi:hypothetical protein